MGYSIYAMGMREQTSTSTATNLATDSQSDSKDIEPPGSENWMRLVEGEVSIRFPTLSRAAALLVQRADDIDLLPEGTW